METMTLTLTCYLEPGDKPMPAALETGPQDVEVMERAWAMWARHMPLERLVGDVTTSWTSEWDPACEHGPDEQECDDTHGEVWGFSLTGVFLEPS